MPPPPHCALCAPRAKSAALERPETGRAEGRRRALARDLRATMNGLTMVITFFGLFAAIAAGALLLDSADTLRQRGSRATDEATVDGVGQLEIMDVYGRRSGSGVGFVIELLTVSPAAEAVNLSGLAVTLSSGGEQVTFTYAAESSPGTFTARAMRDRDGSFSAAGPVITQGDLVEILLPVGEAAFDIMPRARVDQSLTLGEGDPGTSSFYAPSTFAGGDLVDFEE